MTKPEASSEMVSRETFRALVVKRIEALRLGAKYRVKRFRVRRNYQKPGNVQNGNLYVRSGK